jgi:hypothetical protein
MISFCRAGSPISHHIPVSSQPLFLCNSVGIRDILVRTRICGSVPLGIDPDPTPFFSDFKDAKNNFPKKIFLLTNPLASVLKFNFLLKFWKILFCKHYFCPFNTCIRKVKDPELEPDPDSYL